MMQEDTNQSGTLRSQQSPSSSLIKGGVKVKIRKRRKGGQSGGIFVMAKPMKVALTIFASALLVTAFVSFYYLFSLTNVTSKQNFSVVVSPHAAINNHNNNNNKRRKKGLGYYNNDNDNKKKVVKNENKKNAANGMISEMIVKSSAEFSNDAIEMCTRTLWHTLETTTIVLPNGETFIHTGDIDDLWLRDSAAQIHPLLLPLFPSNDNDDENNNNSNEKVALIYNDAKLDRIVSGLIKRHVMYIRHDPYANAFRIDDTYIFNEEQKKLGRHDLISTWNYELDSGCYTIRMIYYYWKYSRNSDDIILESKEVRDAISIMVDLWTAEQQHELDTYPTGPLFDCKNCNKPYRYPGLSRNGKGSPTNATSGLVWSGFRPSDDECQYGYIIPANMFTYVVLGYVQELCDIWHDHDLSSRAEKLQSTIKRGIDTHGIIQHDIFGKIYAYEVDGLGNYNIMDDANVPSLLSIPYIQYPYDKDIYDNTRRFILSDHNPYYKQGTNTLTGPIAGIGSPHMKNRIKNNIWPMAMAIEALTTDDITEAVHITEQLVQATANTGWMHESFDVNNPKHYTRSWFCWADSLFAELMLRLSPTGGCPDPNYKYKILDWRDPITVHGGIYADS